MGVPVHVGEQFANIWSHAPQRTIIITDAQVHAHWGHLFGERPCIILPAGEEQKSLAVVEQMVNTLLELGADRGSFLLGVGGGVVCDLTGFVASVFMRGIPFAFAPSTLLAQVDASIGGKNGVNTGPFKNMIGVFRQPEFILNDPDFLQTLPESEISNGLAECIKHACIRSRDYFGWIGAQMGPIRERRADVLEFLILESVRIKCAIVEADPLERDQRRLLNYGHTFGHVLEKRHGWPHGVAVSAGIRLVNRMALDRGLLTTEEEQRINGLLLSAGLPEFEDLQHYSELLLLVRSDKKKEGDHMAFVLLQSIGNAVIERIALHD
jgi:3-dehydroquinate synthase